MDTSYVAVGTVMSMITDSLTCCPQKSPAGTGRRCRSWCRTSWPAQGPSWCPGHPCGAARASRPCRDVHPARPALPLAYPWRSSQRHRPSYTVSPAGQRLKHIRPALGAAQAVGRHKKAPPGGNLQRGQEAKRGWPVLGHLQDWTLQISHASGFCGRAAPTWRPHLATGDSKPYRVNTLSLQGP